MENQEQFIKLFGATITFHPSTGRQPKDDPKTENHTGDKRPDKIIPCPRCKSMETKFCYFNNYNVKQPRHFCKGCQRYWTAGGALRNVPVGAGRRKTKPQGRSGLDGFPAGSLYDVPGRMHQFDPDELVVQEWHLTADDSFRHVIPVKRRRSCLGIDNSLFYLDHIILDIANQ
ncbi:hypothetical protein K2173_000783 [Erythroxylum novogranatense]|uniref:Dof-type domain-containing protein n=1 Tax=Erythroxylum novogranatense TaxID=1862640 RepID=A0AAV8T3Z7_9ROSI|nr:hypothetical protein K2173_000783 [Erythroxylum novogranatense]